MYFSIFKEYVFLFYNKNFKFYKTILELKILKLKKSFYNKIIYLKVYQ